MLALRLTKVPRVHPTLRVPRLPGGFVQLIKPGVKYEKVSRFDIGVISNTIIMIID